MIYYFMCHGSLYHNMNVCHDITNDKTKQNFEHKQKISRVYAVPAKLLKSTIDSDFCLYRGSATCNG